MRGDQRQGCRGAGPRRFGECLDERREVGSRIGEQVFDPALGEKCQIGFCYSLDSKFLRAIRPLLSNRSRWRQYKA